MDIYYSCGVSLPTPHYIHNSLPNWGIHTKEGAPILLVKSLGVLCWMELGHYLEEFGAIGEGLIH